MPHATTSNCDTRKPPENLFFWVSYLLGLDNFSIYNCMLRLCYVRKNRYFRRSRLSEAKFRLIMRYFTQDLPASKIAALSDVSRPTINQRFFELRPRIAQLCNALSPFSGEVEGDESSFGARRWRPPCSGKKGHGAGGKTIVFGISEHRHFSRNPKWGPSDFGCKQWGAGHCLRRPAFVPARTPRGTRTPAMT